MLKKKKFRKGPFRENNSVLTESTVTWLKLNEDNLLFQRFLIDKLREGYLLVLLSKNNQSDVENTFEIMQNSMILRREHFAIVKVNWHPKHLNLYEAAKELNLSLDSFIFFDDSPVECLNMRMNLGEDILVIQIPTNDSKLKTTTTFVNISCCCIWTAILKQIW